MLGLTDEQEGDQVAEFDQLCEVQSDKASVEITSQYEGTVRRLLHTEGDIVQVRICLFTLFPLVKCIAIVAAFYQQALQGISARAGRKKLYMAPALRCSFMLIAACRQVGEALLELESNSEPDDAAQPGITDSAGKSSMDSIAAGGSEESKHDSASSALQASLGSLQKPKMGLKALKMLLNDCAIVWCENICSIPALFSELTMLPMLGCSGLCASSGVASSPSCGKRARCHPGRRGRYRRRRQNHQR